MDDSAFRWTDAAIVFATLLGPVLAVQTQKFLERRGEEHRRRVQLFEDLMATRATNLSPRHIDALNAIPIVFYKRNWWRKNSKAQLGRIQEEWKAYLVHLSDRRRLDANFDIWDGERIEKLVTLLFSISCFLNYNFDRQDIETGIYSPEGPARLEREQQAIISGLAALLYGKTPLQVQVVEPTETSKL